MGGRQQWYAGVDWEADHHIAFLTDGDGRKIGEKLQAWRRGAGRDGRLADGGELRRQASQILAAIEVPHGPVVETLIERGFKVHAIGEADGPLPRPFHGRR